MEGELEFRSGIISKLPHTVTLAMAKQNWRAIHQWLTVAGREHGATGYWSNGPGEERGSLDYHFSDEKTAILFKLRWS